jgi:zinc transporter 9
MTYISSLISGVGIFCFGTGLAWYHGVLVLLHPQEIESIFWVKKKRKQNRDLF